MLQRAFFPWGSLNLPDKGRRISDFKGLAAEFASAIFVEHRLGCHLDFNHLVMHRVSMLERILSWTGPSVTVRAVLC